MVVAQNGRLTQWILSLAATLVTAIAASLWYDQREVTKALVANTIAIRELSLKLESYTLMGSDRAERLEKEHEQIINRLNRGGIKP